MMRFMYDAVTPSRIPRDAQMVAGYLNGPYAWKAADWALFPHAVKVGISVRASYRLGHVLDVELGDATPAESVDWVLARRAAGAIPTVYCNQATLGQVINAFNHRRVSAPLIWIAHYDGLSAIPYGMVAKQFRNTAAWDESSVVDHWPGVDYEPPTTLKEDGMYTFTVPTGTDRFPIVVPADREVSITLCSEADVNILEYGWVSPDGGNGFTETVQLHDRGAHNFRPPRGTGKVDMVFSAPLTAPVYGVVDVIS